MICILAYIPSVDLTVTFAEAFVVFVTVVLMLANIELYAALKM
jgi:hypothetical protein